MVHMLFIIMLLMSSVFLRLSHPVSMGIMLIWHTLVVGLITGPLVGTFMFSYILFLVFLGGVLVLFIYMTSLASNEKFSVGWGDYLVLGAGAVLVLGLLLVLIMPSGFAGFSGDIGMGVAPGAHLGVMLAKLYSEGSCWVTVFLVIYLLFTLIVCVNVVGVKSGPLRNFN